MVKYNFIGNTLLLMMRGAQTLNLVRANHKFDHPTKLLCVLREILIRRVNWKVVLC